jgi:hypothetical protein
MITYEAFWTWRKIHQTGNDNRQSWTLYSFAGPNSRANVIQRHFGNSRSEERLPSWVMMA